MDAPIAKRGPRRDGTCEVPGCDRAQEKSVFCSAHKYRNRVGSDMSVPIRPKAKPSPDGRRVDAKGYVRISVDGPAGKKVSRFEHRVVMERLLGRELLPDESVHHINGVRSDNRPKNLELWSRSQPSGQRVQDKIEWARNILETYGDEVTWPV